MVSSSTVILLGASVRALAGSALRAGLSPHGIDCFADTDLLACCPATRLAGADPGGFLDALTQAPPGPWMFTGGLENSPALLERMAEQRPLWGIVGAPLRAVRSPALLTERLHRAGLPVPRLHFDMERPPEHGRWLLKPRRGAGGSGIRQYQRWTEIPPADRRRYFLQEQIGGVPVAAIYVGDGPRTRFLGLTMQLIGTRFLHAGPFHYAGSVGPLALDPHLAGQLRRLGRLLGDRGRLRGLFGVDGILQSGTFWPVEVNPRYTASVEVLEFALGQPLLALHRAVFERDAPAPVGFPVAGPCVGKAILCAPHDIIFPPDGPWSASRDRPPVPTRLPPFADIPAAGQLIPEGRPVLSVLVTGATIEDCLAGLQQGARAVLDVLPAVS
jgi:predicted ATP-grasp superfamily ATP-dependent carboligase